MGLVGALGGGCGTGHWPVQGSAAVDSDLAAKAHGLTPQMTVQPVTAMIQ